MLSLWVFGVIFSFCKAEDLLFTTEANEFIKDKMKQCDKLYHIKIDSDNMYAPDFIEKVSLYTPEETTLTLMNQCGYMYEERTGRIASIKLTTPSCMVCLYNEETFEELFLKREFEMHIKVLGKYKYEILEGRNYMLSIHDQNVSNNFGRIFRSAQGKFLEPEEREHVLEAWHLK